MAAHEAHEGRIAVQRGQFAGAGVQRRAGRGAVARTRTFLPQLRLLRRQRLLVLRSALRGLLLRLLLAALLAQRHVVLLA
ncbi:hypothetical protein NB717_000507 [Xanthomonas sacchari]|nr:hypothetical protein [Xanthomonas sacchari]